MTRRERRVTVPIAALVLDEEAFEAWYQANKSLVDSERVRIAIRNGYPQETVDECMVRLGIKP